MSLIFSKLSFISPEIELSFNENIQWWDVLYLETWINSCWIFDSYTFAKLILNAIHVGSWKKKKIYDLYKTENFNY